MKRITVANFKGGQGKTFISCVLAELLAVEGRRVAVVDMDGQQNAVDHLRGVDGERVFDLIEPVPSPGIAPDFKALEAGGCEVAICDTPPGAIMLPAVRDVLAAADVIVVPFLVYRHGLLGVERILSTLPEGVPVLPVCSCAANLTKDKAELLEAVKAGAGVGDGDRLPVAFLPWYDRVDANLSARRAFWYGLREHEYSPFEALRVAVVQLLYKEAQQ